MLLIKLLSLDISTENSTNDQTVKKNYYHGRYYNGWLAMFELLTLDHFAEGFLISY